MSLKHPLEVAREIETELGVNDLARRLMEYPQEIRREQDAVEAARQQMAEAKSGLQLHESLLAAQINGEINPNTGKAMYSNDAARKAELAKRQAEDPGYQEALAKVRDAESALNAAQFDLDMLKDKFSAMKTVAGLIEGQLRLYAGSR